MYAIQIYYINIYIRWTFCKSYFSFYLAISGDNNPFKRTCFIKCFTLKYHPFHIIADDIVSTSYFVTFNTLRIIRSMHTGLYVHFGLVSNRKTKNHSHFTSTKLLHIKQLTNKIHWYSVIQINRLVLFRSYISNNHYRIIAL